MSYAHLEDAFPYVVRVNDEEVTDVVMKLLAERVSFALTTDAPDGERNLWLSQAAYGRMVVAVAVTQADVRSTAEEVRPAPAARTTPPTPPAPHPPFGIDRRPETTTSYPAETPGG